MEGGGGRGVRKNGDADLTYFTFISRYLSLARPVGASSNVIILVMRLCAWLGEQNRRYGSNCMVLVMLRQMYGMANFFNGIRGWRKIWVMWRN